MCILRLSRVSNLYEHQTKAVFDLKLMVGWVYHKMVFDESGFRAYTLRVGGRLNFLWVRSKVFYTASSSADRGGIQLGDRVGNHGYDVSCRPDSNRVFVSDGVLGVLPRLT